MLMMLVPLFDKLIWIPIINSSWIFPIVIVTFVILLIILLMVIRNFYYWLSPNLRLFIRRVYFFPSDLYSKRMRKKNQLIPPKGLIFIGGGDFKTIGSMYLNRFIELGKFKPDHRVLDIGCGIGRIAIPLTTYLNSYGSYEGFDIVKIGIDWCQKKITPKFPNFRFKYISLRNKLYTSENENLARNFIFPYKDQDFDFIILTSVFTHMLPEDMENYLKEIYRVLKPSGKCYVTFFLLNNTSKIAMVNNDELNFTHIHGYFRTHKKQLKEANVAYEESYLINNYLKTAHFEVDKIFYGYWSGRSREKTLDFQDSIILSKKVNTRQNQIVNPIE